ncbi:MAG: lysine--tRNA ligase, partial [Clostridiales bacterium]|nr:lysine--tRNA ligase [Clostridiales bacterium]
MDNINNNGENTEINPELFEQDVSEQQQIRRDKLNSLIKRNLDPYKHVKYDQTHYSKNILNEYESLEGQTVGVAGRIISKRIMGKASFAQLQDSMGRIQIYVRLNDIGEEPYNDFKAFDIGDIVGAHGFVFKTKTGEISIHVNEITLLTKSLHPLPEKFHGLRDNELRYRQRFVDLIVNAEVKDTFVKRSKIISEIRRFLDSRDYLEVETPVLNTTASGANARPFITHHNSLDIDMYLRIALELRLKQCVVGGLERVYELGRVFRNEGMDSSHNPEFTMLELYEAYTDYYGMMKLAEDLISHCAMKVCGSTKVMYQGNEIDLTPPYRRVAMSEIVKEYTGVDFYAFNNDEKARKAAKDLGVVIEDNTASTGKVLFEVFDAFVEDKLLQPTFVIDYPTEVSPLSKKKPNDPRLTERFELFIASSEYANAFSELNDPIDQRERFM